MQLYALNYTQIKEKFQSQIRMIIKNNGTILIYGPTFVTSDLYFFLSFKNCPAMTTAQGRRVWIGGNWMG